MLHRFTSHKLSPGISPLPASVHISQQLWVAPASPVYLQEGWGETHHGSLATEIIINVD
jgi:hypothetical protein